MSHMQLAVTPATQTTRFDRIRQLKRIAGIDKLLMLVEFLFGCWHRNLSRPFTLSGWTYEVCLNCGRKFAYNRAQIVVNIPRRNNAGLHGQFWG